MSNFLLQNAKKSERPCSDSDKESQPGREENKAIPAGVRQLERRESAVPDKSCL